MSETIYTCWTKGTAGESGEPRYSENWAAARRGFFRVFEDRIECCGWMIPFSMIEDARLYRVLSYMIPCRVLQVVTADVTYQFGFNPWANPFRHLPLELEEERAKIGMSPASLVTRLVLIGCVVYWIWHRWR